jgi:hypothetical protein
MEVTWSRLSRWICNRNRNLQHAVADRQSNFQACSFNHSDISPSLKSTICERAAGDYRTRHRGPSVSPRSSFASMVCTPAEISQRLNCVRPVNPHRSLAAILERGVSISAATSRVLAAARRWAKSAGDRRTPILLIGTSLRGARCGARSPPARTVSIVR